jgi:prepilin-type N-terminal cleavage/methylation domain-containing protein/prepilin-type processing-associated H-X9-DG protein
MYGDRQSAISNRQSGFTLIELLVVVAIIAVLAAMLLPSLQRAKEAGKSVICVNNLRQLYLANLNYASDYNDYVTPYNDRNSPLYSVIGMLTWPFKLMPYLGYRGTAEQYWYDTYNHGSLEIRTWVQNPPGVWKQYGYKDGTDTSTKAPCVWFCPATRGPMGWSYPTASAHGWGYVYIDYAPNSIGIAASIDTNGQYLVSGYNYNPIKVGQTGLMTDPGKLVFIGDCYGYSMNMVNVPSNRHYANGYDNTSGRCNVVFWDGHVESIPNLQWNVPGSQYQTGPERLLPGYKYYAYGYNY